MGIHACRLMCTGPFKLRKCQAFALVESGKCGKECGSKARGFHDPITKPPAQSLRFKAALDQADV